MGLTRRALLRRAGLTLAALGISEATLALLSDRYQQVLAQPTRRKLALLVGINQYPEQVSDAVATPLRDRSKGTILNGCLTDVELQQQLLIHRFGFQPSDILCLTDRQATRQAIADAFRSHLTEQARPGDVVVFHFSGMGSRVKTGEAGTEIRNALVPVDGVLPTEENPAINDLLEETLRLLLRSLQTEQVTAVLDVGYSDPGKALPSNLRIRSRPSAPTGQISAAELTLQEQLLSQIQANQSPFRRSNALPGAVLTAAKSGQVVAEGQWSGFSAGLFTYTLTQQLWQATPAMTLSISLSHTATAVEQRVGEQQQPQLSSQKQQDTLSPYYLRPESEGADGVVTALEEDGRTVQLWLAGLPALVLESYGTSSLLTLQTNDPASSAIVQIRSRDGLKAVARVANPDAPPLLLEAGQRVQETVRVFPREINLTVALDSNLERIERVDAASAFAAIPHVSAVAAGEQPADYLFGKSQPVTPALASALSVEATDGLSPLPKEELPLPQNGYGLFNLGRAAIPNTLVEGEEAVKTAVGRLTPQLRSLLAIKLLRLTENSGSSRLGVRATLEMIAPQERLIMQQETVRVAASPEQRSPHATDGTVPTLPVGSRIQYRLQNDGDRPVYFVLVGLDSNGGAIALYPTPADKSAELAFSDSMIAPGASLTLPKTPNADWMLHSSPGLAETHLVFSSAPLTQTFTALTAAIGSDNTRRISPLLKPLEVAQAILQDLHQASDRSDLPSDAYALDVNCWATLNFTYHVAEV